MCGIAGFNGKSSKKPDFNVIKILGILNEERGKDSAGIVVNNTILKEGNKTTFRELTESNKFDVDNIRGNVMLHTRAATVGALTDENAHPYYYKEKDKDGMFFMHNGTITNIDDLVTKYGVNVDGYLTDSRKLGALIYNKHFTVFDEYLGAASICFYFESSPNTIYLFNGAGYDNDRKKWIPERDLYYVCFNDGRMYFSSQENHLKNALNSPKDIKQCTPNHLMKFVDGKLASSSPFERKKRYATSTNKTVDYIEVPSKGTGYFGKGYDKSYLYGYNTYDPKTQTSYSTQWILNGGNAKFLSLKKFSYSFFFIEFCMNEFFAKNIAENHIYFNMYKYMDSNTKKPANGYYLLDSLGQIVDGEKVFNTDVGVRYFYDGIMLDGKATFDKIQEGFVSNSFGDTERRSYAKANAHKDTLYLTSMSGIFESRYNKYQIENMQITEAFSVPFSPFIFLMEKSVLKGFTINKTYHTFFDTDAMYEILKSKARTDTSFMSNLGFKAFDSFTPKMFEERCLRSADGFMTFSEVYEEEKEYLEKQKSKVDLHGTSTQLTIPQVREIAFEEWVDVEDLDTAISEEAMQKKSTLTVVEDDDEEYIDVDDEEEDDDIVMSMLYVLENLDAELSEIAEMYDRVCKKNPNHSGLAALFDILSTFDHTIAQTRSQLESIDLMNVEENQLEETQS